SPRTSITTACRPASPRLRSCRPTRWRPAIPSTRSTRATSTTSEAAMAASDSPIQHWHAEHAYFNRLLALLQREVLRFHAGERPNYELMLDIVRYLREYGDDMHHPREDAAFAILAARCADLRQSLAKLAQEHRVIARAGEALEKQLAAA